MGKGYLEAGLGVVFLGKHLVAREPTSPGRAQPKKATWGAQVGLPTTRSSMGDQCCAIEAVGDDRENLGGTDPCAGNWLLACGK